MFALNRLKEQSLRRLYKFILKRVIGQYLETELVLEQLAVESRTGLVSLKNLRFNVKLLNELLQGMPFQIVSAEVAELQATISYDTLMADGCNLTAKGCKVVFAPVEPPSVSSSRGHKKHPASSNSSKTSPSTPSSDTSQSNPPSTTFSSSTDEEDPLLFIAQWIEVVIARLQCTVQDLEVIFVSHSQIANIFSQKDDISEPEQTRSEAAASVHFLFDTISFYNTHPKMLQGDGNSSTIASTSHILGGSFDPNAQSTSASYMETADIALLSFRKLLSVKSIRVEIKTHTVGRQPSSSSTSSPGCLPLLHFTEGGQIEMMLQPPPQKRRSTYVNSAGRREVGGLGHSRHTQSLAHNQAALDMEITFPKLVCNLQASQAPVLMAVVNSFVDGKPEASGFSSGAKAVGGATPLPLHPELGADVQQLREGLQSLHQKHTLHHLDVLGARFSGGREDGEVEGVSSFPGSERGGDGDGEEVDFGRLAHLLKKYQLTRELLSAEDRARRAAKQSQAISSTGTSSSLPHGGASFLSSPVESDSDVDFPTERTPAGVGRGYDYDSEEEQEQQKQRNEGKEDSDEDELDSGMFFDTADEGGLKRSMRQSRSAAERVRVVRKGTTSTSTHTDQSSLNQSLYGAQSMADSSMFHTTSNVSFSQSRSTKPPPSHMSTPPPAEKGGGGSYFRLFVDSTEIIYQDDRFFAPSAENTEKKGINMETKQEGKIDEHLEELDLQDQRARGEKLVLHLDTAVMSFSAPPAPPVAAHASPVAAVPKFSASVSGIVLYERVLSEPESQPAHQPRSKSSQKSGGQHYKYQNNVLVRFSADKVPDMSSLVIPPEPAQQNQNKSQPSRKSAGASGGTDSGGNDHTSAGVNASGVFEGLEENDDEEDEGEWGARGGSVFVGPQLEVRGSLRPLDPVTGKGGTSVEVHFGHASTTLCVATLLKWIKRVEGVAQLYVPQDEGPEALPPFRLQCAVYVKSLEVILLCDPAETLPSPSLQDGVDVTSSMIAPVTASSLWTDEDGDSPSSSPPPLTHPENPQKPRFRTNWTQVSTGLGLAQVPTRNPRWKKIQSDSVYRRADTDKDADSEAPTGTHIPQQKGSSNPSSATRATPPGCLRVVVVGVSVQVVSSNLDPSKYQTQTQTLHSSSSSFSLHVSSINGFMRLSSPYLPVSPTSFTSFSSAATLQGYYHTYELGFLSMRSHSTDRISVTKREYSTTDIASQDEEQKNVKTPKGPSNGNMQEDLSKSTLFAATSEKSSPNQHKIRHGRHSGVNNGNKSGVKDLEEIIEINTQIVRGDLRSLELNAFIGIITGIIPTPPPASSSPPPAFKNNNNKSRSRVSHDGTWAASSPQTQSTRQGLASVQNGGAPVVPGVVKPKSFLALRVFSHILSVRFAPDCIACTTKQADVEGTGVRKDKESKKNTGGGWSKTSQDDVFCYCFSIREPLFELVSSTTYPPPRATDSSVLFPPSPGASSVSAPICTYLVKDLYTIAASDLSFFEVPLSQLENAETSAEISGVGHSGGRGESCRGARFRESVKRGEGEESHHLIPLLHRTSLESAMMGTGTGSETETSSTSSHHEGGIGGKLGGLRPKHRALRFTVCMEEEVTLSVPPPSSSSSSFMYASTFSASSVPATSSIISSSLRNTSFDLCLSDMTYRFDPSSIWFQRFPAIFDPIGSTDIIPATVISTSASISGDGAAVESTSPAVNVFGRTRLHLSVNKLLVDCCQPDRTEEKLRQRLRLTHSLPSAGGGATAHQPEGKKAKNYRHRGAAVPSADSRLLLSLGNVSVSSTLVTNSDRVALSATVTDASVRVSNQLLRTTTSSAAASRSSGSRDGRGVGPVERCLEQSPVDILGYYIEETYQQQDNGHSSTVSPAGRDVMTIDFDSFVDAHGLVLMGALDRCSVKIHLNTPSAALAAARQRLEHEQATLSNLSSMDVSQEQDSRRFAGVGGGLFGDQTDGEKTKEVSDKDEESNIIPIAVECSLGTAAVYGCADSLLVLVDAITDMVDNVNATKSTLEVTSSTTFTSDASSEDITDDIPADFPSSLSASESGSALNLATLNSHNHSTLPVPSPAALMLSPVSAIRHSFLTSEQQERQQQLLKLNSLKEQPPPSALLSDAKANTNMQKSVSFFFESPYEDEEEEEGSESRSGLWSLPPSSPSTNVPPSTSSTSRSGGGGQGATLKPPKLSLALAGKEENEYDHDSKNGFGDDGRASLWGDDIAECFGSTYPTDTEVEETGTDSSVTQLPLPPVTRTSATPTTTTATAAGGKKSAGGMENKEGSDLVEGREGAGGLLRDSSWLDSLQEDMFAPSSMASGTVGVQHQHLQADDGQQQDHHQDQSVKRVVYSSHHRSEKEGGAPVTFPTTSSSVMEEEAVKSVAILPSTRDRDRLELVERGGIGMGLGAAVIEEYYPEPEQQEEEEDEPEFEARFYAQYDYDSEGSDVDINGEAGISGFAYEENEDEGFEEIDEEEEDEMSESELDRRRDHDKHKGEDDDELDASEVSSHSASGYSESSFGDNSEESAGELLSLPGRGKGKEEEKGGLWQSWGVMKSVTDLRQKQQRDQHQEEQEMADMSMSMSTSVLYKTTVMTGGSAGDGEERGSNKDEEMGTSTLLTVDVDTDSEGSVVSVEEDTTERTSAMPFVQVHSEGGVDQDHQRAWESMSFYQTTQQQSSQQHKKQSQQSQSKQPSSSEQITSGGKSGEQKAMWYDQSSVQPHQIHPLHIPEPARDSTLRDGMDNFPRDPKGVGGQCIVTPKINISVKFSIRVKLFAGREWPEQPQSQQDMRRRERRGQQEGATSSSSSTSQGQGQGPSLDQSGRGVRRGKYDNSATIEKHLGGLSNQRRDRGTGADGLFPESEGGRGRSTRTLQQAQTAKNLALKHTNAVSSQRRLPQVAGVGEGVGRLSSSFTEISFSACRVVYRLYPHQPPASPSTSAFTPPPLPTDRYALRIHDMLVSYTQSGRKPKKVLGNWLNPSKPVESHLPLIAVTAVGFDLNDTQPQSSKGPVGSAAMGSQDQQGLEYRLEVTVLPLRCYLDGAYVSFIRGFVSYLTEQQRRQQAREAAISSHLLTELGLVAMTEKMDEKDNERENDGDAEGERREEGVKFGRIPNSDRTASTSSKIQDALSSTSPEQKKVQSQDKEISRNHDKDADGDDSGIGGVHPLPVTTFFQSWKVHPVELKINYSPDPLDLRALQGGDYMQLLNLLSIEALELSLTKVWLVGVSGAAAGWSKTGEEWVREIYAHQMHRLLSSAGPLRGLSSIGSSVHGLLLVPVQEYRTNGAAGVLRAFRRESVSLLKTVTRETLTASSKLSHFLANTLIDLVTPEGSGPSNRRQRESGGGRTHRSEKQPKGFADSLDRAYEAVSREVTSTLDTIVVLPFREYQRTGQAGGALKCVVRAIPVAVLRPTAGAAEALSYTLLGLRNNLDPDKRKDEEDVWNVDLKEEM